MSTFDLTSPHFHAEPFPTLDSMRATGTIVSARLPIVGRTWLAVTHDTCAELLKNHDHFARDPANAGNKTQARILKFLPRTISLLASNMLGHDDPASSPARTCRSSLSAALDCDVETDGHASS